MNEDVLAAPVLWAFFDLQESIFFIIRVVAAVGGAVFGWILTPMLLRPVYRLLARRPIPNWAVPWSRLGGGLGLALLLFWFLPLGGGGGGWGWGAGPGGGKPGAIGGPGKYPGNQAASDKKTEVKDKEPHDKKADLVKIEMLGGKHYKGDERYYLLKQEGPAKTLDEIKDYFKQHKNLELSIVFSAKNESVADGHMAVLNLVAEIETTYHYRPKFEYPDLEKANKAAGK